MARPDLVAGLGHTGRVLAASMEGRAMARPDGERHDVALPGWAVASMEGRAMARPDRRCWAPTRSVRSCFNGGPSNGSARRSGSWRGCGRIPASMEGRAMARPDAAASRTMPSGSAALQWRAEQWLGQTRGGKRLLSLRNNLASMEGRAMARPDCRSGSRGS